MVVWQLRLDIPFQMRWRGNGDGLHYHHHYHSLLIIHIHTICPITHTYTHQSPFVDRVTPCRFSQKQLVLFSITLIVEWGDLTSTQWDTFCNSYQNICFFFIETYIFAHSKLNMNKISLKFCIKLLSLKLDFTEQLL